MTRDFIVDATVNAPRLFRRRFIPDELVALDRDEVLSFSEDYGVIVTRWKMLHSKAGFGGGVSVYYADKGVKISRFYDTDGNFMFWYCDIVRCSRVGNELTFIDLLADVEISPDGRVKVLDLGELAEARDLGLIDDELLKESLKKTDRLLGEIYAGRFGELSAPADAVVFRP